MTTLACCFSQYVRVGTAQSEVHRTHLWPHTASLCHVESVDIGAVACFSPHLPSLQHLETSATKPSMERESNGN